jgi:hypothetical protein
MANTRDRVFDAAGNMKPYVDRAMNDEKLRSDVLRAFQTARELYSDLTAKDRSAVTLATRVATDDDVREKLREAIEDLRSANERLQGRKSRSGGRTATILVAGIALGILFNPVTGPDTRRFIRDIVTGGGDDLDGFGSANGGGPSTDL